MKRLFLSIALCCILADSAWAQISGGIKAGLNLASWGGDADDTNMKPGLLAVFFLTAPITDQFSIQPELLYNAVGTKFEDADDISYRLNYLSIPVMVQYNVTEQFKVEAGPQVGFLASAHYKNDDDKTDMKDAFKGTDFGFNLGVGATFDNFTASLRYSFGLANVFDDDSFGFFDFLVDDVDIKNNTFQISIGYTLFHE